MKTAGSVCGRNSKIKVEIYVVDSCNMKEFMFNFSTLLMMLWRT